MTNNYDSALRLLTSARVRTCGAQGTKYIAVLYGPWGFQKHIWEPWVTKSKLYTEVKLS